MDDVGEARAQAVLPCSDFCANLGRRRGTHCNSDVGGCGAGWKLSIPCSGPVRPALLLVMSDVRVGAGQNKELFLQVLLFFSIPK